MLCGYMLITHTHTDVLFSCDICTWVLCGVNCVCMYCGVPIVYMGIYIYVYVCVRARPCGQMCLTDFLGTATPSIFEENLASLGHTDGLDS